MVVRVVFIQKTSTKSSLRFTQSQPNVAKNSEWKYSYSSNLPHDVLQSLCVQGFITCSFFVPARHLPNKTTGRFYSSQHSENRIVSKCFFYDLIISQYLNTCLYKSYQTYIYIYRYIYRLYYMYSQTLSEKAQVTPEIIPQVVRLDP